MNTPKGETKTYVGTFIKTSGEVRTMKFAKVDDLPPGFLPETKEKKLQEGLELVWDIENNAYRTFNHKTLVGDLKEEVSVLIKPQTI